MSCPAFKSIRLAAVLGAATVLGACALPVPLQVVSLMADGISYMTTQKSITDHGLSAMTGQDCALLRGLSDGKPCRVIEDGDDVQTAEAAPDVPDADATTETEPAVVASPPEVTSPSTKPVPVAASRMAQPIPNPNNGLYLIVGSFVKETDALRHATRMNDLAPKILHGKVKGVRVYRVGVGPLANGGLVAARKTANGLGVYDAWAVNVTLPPQAPEQAPEAVAQIQANILN